MSCPAEGPTVADLVQLVAALDARLTAVEEQLDAPSEDMDEEDDPECQNQWVSLPIKSSSSDTVIGSNSIPMQPTQSSTISSMPTRSMTLMSPQAGTPLSSQTSGRTFMRGIPSLEAKSQSVQWQLPIRQPASSGASSQPKIPPPRRATQPRYRNKDSENGPCNNPLPTVISPDSPSDTLPKSSSDSNP